MSETLPLHPGGGPGSGEVRPQGPGQEIRARRDRVRAQVGVEQWRLSRRPLLVEVVRATLELTGAAPSPEALHAARKGSLPAEFGSCLGALGLLERAAAERDPGADLIAEAHAAATGAGAGASLIRAGQIEPQFEGASLSPPQAISLRLGELLNWISGASGRDLETAPRAALFFARFLEISPFERANFRVAHLMLSFFALADDQPPIWFEAGDAAGIRDDVSRAFRFDTAPLTVRIERALHLSLDRIGAEKPTATMA